MNKISSLYIHIPFCENICEYCDFTKLQYFRNIALPYLEKLKQELDSYHIKDGIKTIYVGGGTPTALEDDLFLELLKIIKPYSLDVQEYTFEANPESLSENKIKMMKEYGVNRLSLGVESTNDEILRLINRHHTFNDVKKAISLAKQYGINNLNVDLILGLPHVNKSLLKEDLANILALDVKHISCYGLTVHEHTQFFLKKIKEPEDDVLREYYDIVEETLTNNGFIHYEISNWAKEGYMSEHNLTYWRNNHYYGVGLSASGYIGNVRYTNTKSISEYNKGVNKLEKEELTLKDEKIYQIILNLRTIEGLDLKLYEGKYHENFYTTFKEILDKFIQEKYLIYNRDKNVIYPTYQGMMILDNLLIKIMEKIS